jgi:CDP-glucose 4,6-dehydratase
LFDPKFWRNRRVFLTGHTGFKGAWMSLFLTQLGARLYGLALPPDNRNNIFLVTDVEHDVNHFIGDVCDYGLVCRTLELARPEIVIHMAAQSLVRRSYSEPLNTYATNVMGTVNVLEAIRHSSDVRAAVIVTSDKCYENVGKSSAYCEVDVLGGHDPYSNSKACAELVTAAYRRSFFNASDSAAIASVRAGNVIGGGDWTADRLVPDAIRAFIAGETLRIRNPAAIRPWQHVLDPVIAYLEIAQRIFERGREYAEAWNFGPGPDSEVSVAGIADRITQLWGDCKWEPDGGSHPYEAMYLTIDSTKARTRLGWRPMFSLDEALRMTVAWYRGFSRNDRMRDLTLGQIEAALAIAQG